MTVRTLEQMELTVKQAQQLLQDVRDSNIRIEQMALELLRVNPESITGKQALEHAQTSLSRGTGGDYR